MKQLRGPELHAFQTAPGATALLLLDVREDWEVKLAPVTVSGLRCVHIPMNDIPSRLAELDPAQPVVCICHHGARSAQVVAFLERQGFDAVYNLAGGSDAWSMQVDASVPRY
ncbi:MAG: rhodanese-like domain-containing protein [Burkholderiaceae bacterium]